MNTPRLSAAEPLPKNSSSSEEDLSDRDCILSQNSRSSRWLPQQWTAIGLNDRKPHFPFGQSQSALSSACSVSTLMNHRSTRTPAMTLILAKPKMPSTTCWHKHGPRVPSREHRSTRTIASAIARIDFLLRPHSQTSAFHKAAAFDHDDRTGELCLLHLIDSIRHRGTTLGRRRPSCIIRVRHSHVHVAS